MSPSLSHNGSARQKHAEASVTPEPARRRSNSLRRLLRSGSKSRKPADQSPPPAPPQPSDHNLAQQSSFKVVHSIGPVLVAPATENRTPRPNDPRQRAPQQQQQHQQYQQHQQPWGTRPVSQEKQHSFSFTHSATARVYSSPQPRSPVSPNPGNEGQRRRRGPGDGQRGSNSPPRGVARPPVPNRTNFPEGQRPAVERPIYNRSVASTPSTPRMPPIPGSPSPENPMATAFVLQTRSSSVSPVHSNSSSSTHPSLGKGDAHSMGTTTPPNPRDQQKAPSPLSIRTDSEPTPTSSPSSKGQQQQQQQQNPWVPSSPSGSSSTVTVTERNRHASPPLNPLEPPAIPEEKSASPAPSQVAENSSAGSETSRIQIPTPPRQSRNIPIMQGPQMEDYWPGFTVVQTECMMKHHNMKRVTNWQHMVGCMACKTMGCGPRGSEGGAQAERWRWVCQWCSIRVCLGCREELMRPCGGNLSELLQRIEQRPEKSPETSRRGSADVTALVNGNLEQKSRPNTGSSERRWTMLHQTAGERNSGRYSRPSTLTLTTGNKTPSTSPIQSTPPQATFNSVFPDAIPAQHPELQFSPPRLMENGWAPIVRSTTSPSGTNENGSAPRPSFQSRATDLSRTSSPVTSSPLKLNGAVRLESTSIDRTETMSTIRGNSTTETIDGKKEKKKWFRGIFSKKSKD